MVILVFFDILQLPHTVISNYEKLTHPNRHICCRFDTDGSMQCFHQLSHCPCNNTFISNFCEVYTSEHSTVPVRLGGFVVDFALVSVRSKSLISIKNYYRCYYDQFSVRKNYKNKFLYLFIKVLQN